MNQAEKAILNETPRLVYGREELEDKDALLLTFFGDGFTEKEQELFFAEAKRMAKYMMATSPWDEYADAVKIYAIGVCSNESGVRADHARTQAEADADTRDSYFHASFWTFTMLTAAPCPMRRKSRISTRARSRRCCRAAIP